MTSDQLNVVSQPVKQYQLLLLAKFGCFKVGSDIKGTVLHLVLFYPLHCFLFFKLVIRYVLLALKQLVENLTFHQKIQKPFGSNII